MNSVAVASATPSLQPTTTASTAATTAALRSSSAVHAAMQRSALARQAYTNNTNNNNTNNTNNANNANNANFTNFTNNANITNNASMPSNPFASQTAQMQAQQAAYYAPVTTRTRRAGSRDRAWTDSTTEKDQQAQQIQQIQPQQPESGLSGLLRPRVTRVVATAHASPEAQRRGAQHQHQQPHQQYQFKQQQQFPTLVHQHARTRPQQPQPQQAQLQQQRQPQLQQSHPRQHNQQQPLYQQRASLTRNFSPSARHETQQQQQQRSRPSSTRASPSQQLRTQPQPEPEPVAAAVEWRVAIDPKSKRPYYYHPVTRQTTWKKPQELVDQEKHERASFFAAMESNIRAKLRDGNWFRDSLQSRPGDLDDMALAEEDDDEGELSSSTSTSSRSSWSSTTTASVASAPHRARGSLVAQPQPSQPQHTRSLPTSPESHGPKASSSSTTTSHSNQDDHDADADTDALLLGAAAAKPPTLFRTLSSYETPVVGETKKFVNGRMMTVPSPIVERVRLAGMDELPRSSDLEAYTRPDIDTLLNPDGTADAAPGSSKDAESASSRGIVRQPLRRRSNSTSTIFVRMGTMNKPDQDTTIQCVATVLRAHLMEAQAAPIDVDGKFELFVNQRDQRADAIPSLKDIGVFIKHVFSRAQMESECIIMSLIYVERLLKATMGLLQLRPANWRAILFCSMVMASKVWDDLSMCNADFSKIWPELSLKEINDLELAYLGAVEYNVRVSAVSYAKYYFHLRSMCASMGMLKSFDESAPLNLDGARKMQVLSEEYQERTKLLPAPSRRRSVTITTPSSAAADSRAAALAGGSSSGSGSSGAATAKWSPTASLEQLVQMQSRVAGGTSLASMHRLSTASASSRA